MTAINEVKYLAKMITDICDAMPAEIINHMLGWINYFGKHNEYMQQLLWLDRKVKQSVFACGMTWVKNKDSGYKNNNKKKKKLQSAQRSRGNRNFENAAHKDWARNKILGQ